MGKVPADPFAAFIGRQGRFDGAGASVVETHMAVHEITDRLHPPPARGSPVEQGPGQIVEQITFAVAAREQEQQRVFRQSVHRHLLQRWQHRIGLTRIQGSITTPVACKRSTPAGATSRWHWLP